MNRSPVIVVTGAACLGESGNRGIGNAICQFTAEHWVVYACPGIELPFQSSRAVYFRYPKLDITDASSIEYLAETIKDEEGGVDVLFNNAGLNTARSHTGPSAFADNKKTMDVYFWGTSQVCMTLLPLMRPGGRIVNLSSVASSLQSYSEDLQKRFRNSRMTLLDLQTLAAEYEVEKTMLTAPQTYPNAGTNKEHGWPDSGYAVSKACINAMTAIIARETPSVLINVCCPGWVASDMGRQVALQPPKSAIEGARIPQRLGFEDIRNTSSSCWANSSVADTNAGRVQNW